MSNYEDQFNEIYEENPARALGELVAATVNQRLAQTEGQIHHNAWLANQAQNETLVAAQTESAILESDRALNAKYTDWKEIRGSKDRPIMMQKMVSEPKLQARSTIS